jgi:hypothetical protein
MVVPNTSDTLPDKTDHTPDVAKAAGPAPTYPSPSTLVKGTKSKSYTKVLIEYLGYDTDDPIHQNENTIVEEPTW